MSKVRIFRIVDENGQGMYTGANGANNRSLWELCCGKNVYSLQHPRPEEDGIFDYTYTHMFAFQSIDLLKQWVHKPEWLNRMHDRGGRIECWDVDESNVKMGGTQCVFDRNLVFRDQMEYSLPVKDALQFERERENESYAA